MKHFNDYQEYLSHWVFKAIRQAAMESTNWRCMQCGNPATEVHHINYPKPWGTFDVPANLTPICHACHCAKHKNRMLP